jgi:hypothetical protein
MNGLSRKLRRGMKCSSDSCGPRYAAPNSDPFSRRDAEGSGLQEYYSGEAGDLRTPSPQRPFRFPALAVLCASAPPRENASLFGSFTGQEAGGTAPRERLLIRSWNREPISPLDRTLGLASLCVSTRVWSCSFKRGLKVPSPAEAQRRPEAQAHNSDSEPVLGFQTKPRIRVRPVLQFFAPPRLCARLLSSHPTGVIPRTAVFRPGKCAQACSAWRRQTLVWVQRSCGSDVGNRVGT